MPCLSERPGSATQRCFVIGWKGSGGEEEDFGRIIIAIYVREDSDGVIERWTDRTTAQREGSRMVRGGSPGRCGRDEVTRQVCAKCIPNGRSSLCTPVALRYGSCVKHSSSSPSVRWVCVCLCGSVRGGGLQA